MRKEGKYIWCTALLAMLISMVNAQPLQIQWAKPAIPADADLIRDPDGWVTFTNFYFWDQEYKRVVLSSVSTLWMGLDVKANLNFCGFVHNFHSEVVPLGWINDSVLLERVGVDLVWYNVYSGIAERKIEMERAFLSWNAIMLHRQKELVLSIMADIFEGMQLGVWDFEGKLQRILADSAMRIFGDRRIWIATLRTNPDLDFCVVVYVPEHNYFANDTVSVLVRKINLDTWEVEKEFVVGPLYEGASIRSLSPSGRFAVLDYWAKFEDYLLDLETGAMWRLGGTFAAVLPDDRTAIYFDRWEWDGDNSGTMRIIQLQTGGGYQTLTTFSYRISPWAMGLDEMIYTTDVSATGDTIYIHAWDGIYVFEWKKNKMTLLPYWRVSMYTPDSWTAKYMPGFPKYERKGMIEISPGGQYLRVMAATGGVEIFRTEDGRRIDGLSELVLEEVAQLERKLLSQLKRYPYAFAFSWDDQMVAIGGYPQADQVSIYQLPQWSLRYRYQVDWDITAVDFSPDGKSLAIGGKDGQIRVCDYYSGNVRKTLQSPRGGEVALVRYCRSGRHLYVVLRSNGEQELQPFMVDVNTGEWKDFRMELSPAFNYPLDIWHAHLVFNREKLLVQKMVGGEIEQDWYDCEEGKYLRIRSDGIPMIGTPYVLRSMKGYKLEVVDTADYRVIAEYDKFLPKQDTAIEWTFWYWNRDSVWLQWDQLAYSVGGWIAGVMQEPPALFMLRWTPSEPTAVKRKHLDDVESLSVGWYWVEVYNMLGQRVIRQWQLVGRTEEIGQRLRLPGGIYFIMVRDSRGEVKWKGQYRVSFSTKEK